MFFLFCFCFFYISDLPHSFSGAPNKIKNIDKSNFLYTEVTHFATFAFSNAGSIGLHAETVAISILHLLALESTATFIEEVRIKPLHSTDGFFATLTTCCGKYLYLNYFSVFIILASTEKERLNSIIT